MSADKWEVLDEVPGSFQAELLRGLLEAQEIPVVLSQEGLGHVYALTVGTLGQVQVLVPAKDLERAKVVLDEFYADINGEHQSDADQDQGTDQPES